MTHTPNLLSDSINLLGNDAVADLLGVPANVPGMWLRGDTQPNKDQIDQINAVFRLAQTITMTTVHTAAVQWLYEPLPELDGASPVEAFQYGQQTTVIRIAEERLPDPLDFGYPI